jgi:hypothetical protein
MEKRPNILKTLGRDNYSEKKEIDLNGDGLQPILVKFIGDDGEGDSNSEGV